MKSFPQNKLQDQMPFPGKFKYLKKIPTIRKLGCEIEYFPTYFIKQA